MTDLPGPIFEWINQHPNLSGLATFIISAAESIAIIGTIIPGSVMMTAIGALAGSGIIPLYQTVVWAILGAIAGDSISYWTGHYFKARLRQMWPFRGYPVLLENGERFVNRHGSMSVFIGRFVGPVRALVPLIAGMLDMKPLRFTLTSMLSALGWAPAYMLPGILLGAASLELPPDIAAHALIRLLMMGLLILLCGWSLIIVLRMINRQIEQMLTWLWRWLEHSRPLHPITTLLRHHDPRKMHGQLILAFYILCAAGIFSALMLDILLNGSDTILANRVFFYFFRSLRTPVGDSIMQAISMLGESHFLVPLAITLSAWLFWQKRRRTAAHVFFLGLFTVASVVILKPLIHSARPGGVLHVNPEFSFPSGHATLSTAFYFAIVLLLMHAARIGWRRLVYWLTALLVILIGISRLYLGVHWFTDVLGGWLLGAILVMVTILSWRRQSEAPLSPRGILLVTVLTLVFTAGMTFHWDYSPQQLNDTQITQPIRTVSMATWWHQTDPGLPLYRINRFGIARQILNLQWVGDLQRIRVALLTHGWQISPETTWIDVLHRVANIKSTEHLPLVAPLYLGQKPVLVLFKNTQKIPELIVLRLWPADIRFSDNKLPLWVGTIEEVPATYSWLQFSKWQISLPLATLLFTRAEPDWQMKTVGKQLNRHYRPRDRMILLVRPATH